MHNLNILVLHGKNECAIVSILILMWTVYRRSFYHSFYHCNELASPMTTIQYLEALYPVNTYGLYVLYLVVTSSFHVNFITMTSKWARWRRKSLASRLLTQPFIQGADRRKYEVPRHWPLWGEFTGCGFPHKWQATRKCFHLMTSSWYCGYILIPCWFTWYMYPWFWRVSVKLYLKQTGNKSSKGERYVYFLGMWIMIILWIKYLIITPFWGRLQFIAAQT